MRPEPDLDPGDIRILQRDATLSVAEVAREAGMSQTPAWRRIKRMRDAGVIGPRSPWWTARRSA